MSLVSVCLPNLNNRSYLEERVETIVSQTYPDWELIVSDNYSEDGAWEFFQAQARKDSRIRIEQAPRAGMYANWNNCLVRARGEYVYIATSDDTMSPDCLEKMVEALEAHPDCDLAHCRLRMIDQNGGDAPDWWSNGSPFAYSSGLLLDRQHIRKAPFDGLLHLSGESVYISITQLLIRRRLFDQIGFFDPRWGSVGDFNWNMRASLVANTVHVPDTWGGWRLHPEQATAGNVADSDDYRRRIEEMIDDAIDKSEKFLETRVRRRLQSDWSQRSRDMRETCFTVRNLTSSARRRAFLTRRLLAGSQAARQHLIARLLGKNFRWREAAPRMVGEWLKSTGVGPCIVPL